MVQEAIITAAIGVAVAGFGTGIVALVRLLTRISRDVASLGPSVQALYAIQPCVIKALRYQNAAFRELGANGSTDRSNECLDEAEKNLDRRLIERVGGCP
jgi:hypothetical protein